MGMFKLVARPCSVCKYLAHRKNMLFTGHVLPLLVISLSLGITFLSMAENNKRRNVAETREPSASPCSRLPSAYTDFQSQRQQPLTCEALQPLREQRLELRRLHLHCEQMSLQEAQSRPATAQPPGVQAPQHLPHKCGGTQGGNLKVAGNGGGGTLQFYLSTETIVSRVDGNLKAPVGEAGPRDLPERGPGSRRPAHCPRPSQGRAAGHSGSESQGHRASQVPASLAPRPA